MRELLRRAALVFFALLVVLTASGCGFKFSLSPEDLYSLPKLPAEYTELDNHIKQILEEGAEYAAPVSGSNIQPVQLVDLNGDGQEEAIAFFRNSADERPLKIYIFTAKDQTYEQTAVIEGTGTGIYSVAYSDLDSDGQMELLVGWRVNTEMQALSVYTLRTGEPEELVSGANYVKYAVTDLDQDQMWELVVLRSDENGNGVADYYCWQERDFLVRTSARITSTMAELSQQGRIQEGTLQEGVPALFVTGVEESLWTITDILAVKNGELVNIMLSDVTGVSTEIAPFCALYPTDINGDNITEVPRPSSVFPQKEAESDAYQRIDWQAYTGEGASTTVLRTYHNTVDGWYLCLPDDWTDRVFFTRSASLGESTVTFTYREDGSRIFRDFLKITALTGSNREVSATRGSRVVLSRQAETIYTAELLEANASWAYGVSEDEVRELFRLIVPEWTTGDN